MHVLISMLIRLLIASRTATLHFLHKHWLAVLCHFPVISNRVTQPLGDPHSMHPCHLCIPLAPFRQCGSTMNLIRPPEGDGGWRHTCTSSACGFVEYFNPKVWGGTMDALYGAGQ